METLTQIFHPDKAPTLTVGGNIACADARPSPPASYCPATNTINVDLAGLQQMGAYTDNKAANSCRATTPPSPQSHRVTCSPSNTNKASR